MALSIWIKSVPQDDLTGIKYTLLIFYGETYLRSFVIMVLYFDVKNLRYILKLPYIKGNHVVKIF